MERRLELLVEQHEPSARSIAAQVWRTAPHALELDELRSLAFEGLVKAAARWDAYCLAPDTPVLTAALRWVPLGTVQPGQELVGVEEYAPARRSRSFEKATVTEVSRRLAYCVRLTFEDGRQVTCTPDHKWLVRRQRSRYVDPGAAGSYNWYRTDELVPGVGVAAPLRTWSEETSFEAARLRSKGVPNALVIESIEPIGVTEVVTIETTSRTFLANGLVSHNCEQNSFDPGRVEYFTPFAERRMRGAIFDELRSSDWATRSQRMKHKQLQQAGLDQGLSESELSAKTGLTVQEIRDTLAGLARRPVYLDADNQDYVDSADVHEDVHSAGVLSGLALTVASLPEAQQAVLALHYYSGMELQQVAQVMGITESRASHLHTDAVLAVRATLREALGV